MNAGETCDSTTLASETLLSACATGMGKDECAAADWRTIGYEDGVRGFPADRIGAHRVACAKHQVTPDLAAYMEGRDRGLVDEVLGVGPGRADCHAV